MLSISLFIKALFSRKIIVITVCSLTTFGFSIYLSIIGKYAILSNILSNIGISFLAAALIAAFESIKGDKAARLIRLFAIDTSGKTVIVIPQFDKGQILLDPNDNTKTVDLNEIPSVSKADCLTANYFVALLLSYNLEFPEIITDTEALDILADEKRIGDYKNFICVGLNSNKFSKQISKSDPVKKIIKFDNEITLPPSGKILSVCENNGWHDYTPERLDATDLALFLRAKCKTNTSNYNIIICGGLNATGTSHLGPFIYKKWGGEMSLLRIDGLRIHRHKNFIMIYKINGLPNVRLDKNARIEPHPFFMKDF